MTLSQNNIGHMRDALATLRALRDHVGEQQTPIVQPAIDVLERELPDDEPPVDDVELSAVGLRSAVVHMDGLGERLGRDDAQRLLAAAELCHDYQTAIESQESDH